MCSRNIYIYIYCGIISTISLFYKLSCTTIHSVRLKKQRTAAIIFSGDKKNENTKRLRNLKTTQPYRSISVFFDFKYLKHVALFKVVKAFKPDSTFVAGGYLLDGILEPLKRGYCVLGDNYAVAHNANPTFFTFMTFLHSARPISTSRVFGASIPFIADSISSMQS